MSSEQIIVALDLETTGLDSTRDVIIEIGAVRFDGEEVLDEWSTFVNPHRKIPGAIVQLTGIKQSDVEDAPDLQSVLPALQRFVGNAPVLGHNVPFDLAFLNRAGVLKDAEAIDTYDIASAMLPSATSYSLGALAGQLGIELPATHRALDDARVTQAVYMQLWQQAMALPLKTLAEIVRAAGHVDWPGGPFFKAAMQIRAREQFTGGQPAPSGQPSDWDINDVWMLPDGPKSGGKRLRPKAIPDPVDTGAIAGLLEEDGALAAILPGFEYRPQQVAMLRAVGDALNNGTHLLIEAGTGVGKSMGYLIPAIHFATHNDERVVISTNTINLQEQLMTKDLPALKESLGIDFRSALLKGRSNYLCPRRLVALRRRGPTSRDEMRMLAKILVWLTQENTGDKGEISLRGPAERGVWSRLSAEDEGCTLDRCSTQMAGTCPFYQARQAANSAHILVVNHALLLADVAVSNRVLPEHRFVIIDEAHHLEDATTNGLSFRADPGSITRMLRDLGTRNSGILGDVLANCRSALPEDYYLTLEDYVIRIEEASSATITHVDLLFNNLQTFIQNHVRVNTSDYSQQIRIQAPLRLQPDWEEVEIAADNLARFTHAIAEAMTRLAGGLGDLENFDIPEYEDLVASASSASRRFNALHSRLYETIFEPDANTIYWVEFRADNQRMSLHAAPLHVGPMVEEHLWHTKDCIIMTSATLQTNDSFSFIRERLNADEASELALGSPFDYETSTLLYLVNDIPEPADRHGFQRAVEQGLIDLCRATEGRALVLFTSHAQLRQTSEAISDTLSASGIVVYDQSSGSSRNQLLESFRSTPKSVLLGTRSYWEGVDVPGEELSVLVIVRLPFAVPSDPIFAARGETFESPFMEYAIPESIIRFRQGFGRLIRRKDDRGVVAIFDRRIISKQYGQYFIDSLPQCTVVRGSIRDLPDQAAEWLSSS